MTNALWGAMAMVGAVVVFVAVIIGVCWAVTRER